MKIKIALGISVAAVCQVTVASAQESDRSRSGLEEIVVTAQKRAESLQDTPLAISAVTAETIEQRGLGGISNLTGIAPNLLVSGPSGGPNNAALFIRSIGTQDPILTADSPVALYVDGIIIARSAGSAFEIADLDRIEVLRGPQGTLYGRNTIGGAVNLITRKPDDTFGIRQKFGIGNYGAMQSRTTVDTGELGNSGLRASFSFLHKQRDGYVDDTNVPDKHDPGAYRTDAVRAAVSFDRKEGFRALYAFDFNRNVGYNPLFQLTTVRPDLIAFFAGSPAAGGGTLTFSPKRLDKVALNDNGPTTDKIWSHTLTLEADLGENATLKSLTGYRKWTQRVQGGELDGQDDLLGTIAGQGATLFPLTLFGANALRHQHQWSQELNLIGKVGQSLDYVLGAYYFEEKADENNPQRFIIVTPNGAIPLLSLLDYRHKSTTKALFAQATWHVTDRFSLTGGMRYTWDERKLDQSSPQPRDLTAKFKKFNWSATADYKFNDDVMVYARIATGYKAGGFSARSFDSGFKPESLTSYELGVKSELFDKRLRFNASAYISDRKDMQVITFLAGSGGAVALTTNAGKAVYKGIELEVNAVPVDGLTAYATFGYVDRKYKEYLILDQATQKDIDISDVAKFSYSASTTFNAGLQYDFPPLSFGKLSARVDYNYLSRRYFDTNPRTSTSLNLLSAPARGLFDARVTLSEIKLGSGTISASLWGRNITNKKYRVSGTDFGSLGFAGNVYGEPATWGVDVSLKL